MSLLLIKSGYGIEIHEIHEIDDDEINELANGRKYMIINQFPFKLRADATDGVEPQFDNWVY